MPWYIKWIGGILMLIGGGTCVAAVTVLLLADPFDGNAPQRMETIGPMLICGVVAFAIGLAMVWICVARWSAQKEREEAM